MRRFPQDRHAGDLHMLITLDHARRLVDTGVSRLGGAAGRIARDGAQGDLAGDLVQLVPARHEVRAGVAVARTADELIGTILDVFA